MAQLVGDLVLFVVLLKVGEALAYLAFALLRNVRNSFIEQVNPGVPESRVERVRV